MKSSVRFVYCQVPQLLVATALCGHFADSYADTVEQAVTQLSAPPGHTIWQISNPIVNQKSTEYPQIKFVPGELVTVSATGCVQTGGSGHTWKRYVDPAGDNTDRLYHGEIWIPGAATALEFYQPRQPTVYTIPKTALLPANAHLTLGYTDDGYGDNGYSGRHGPAGTTDDGNLSQCWGLGNAQITLDITALPAAVAPPATQNYTFTIQNVTIRNLRSHYSDTDVIAAGVDVDGTTSAVASQTSSGDSSPNGNWQRGSHPVSFPIEVDEVSLGNRVAVSYTIVNAGHPDDQTVDNAIVSIVQGIGSATGAAALTAAAAIWKPLFNVADPNCDGPVVADAVLGTGADLATWTQYGPITRTISFPGVSSAVGCGTDSFYEVTYQLARTSSGEQAYSLKVNAKSHAIQTGAASKVLKKVAR